MARKEKKKVQAVKYSDKYLKKSISDRKELSATPDVRYRARVEISRMTVREASRLSKQISHNAINDVMGLMKYVRIK